MPNLLKNLQLEELSLVDRPANAQAMVSLFKRDNSEEEIIKMTEEMEAKVKAYMEEKSCGKPEAMKALGYDMMKEEEEAEPAKMEEAPEVDKAEEATAEEVEIDTLKAENERLRKGLIENGYVIKSDVIEKKAEVEMVEVSGEMVAKSDIPAPVLKALEEAAVEKADIELTKRAGEALPHFDIAVAKALVAKFSDEEIIMEALKAADAAFDAAMQEFGKPDVGGEFATSADKLDTLVKSYMDDNQLKKSDYAKAYAAVAKTDEGKTLINKSYKGE